MHARTRRRFARTSSRQADGNADVSLVVPLMRPDEEITQRGGPDVMRAASREPNTAEKRVSCNIIISLLSTSASSSVRP
ncbi:hypothetical protein IG631_24196 [Alternaria alternata]|nr:hypothetical protein IG631_24196 [Alternaria alternata]